MNRLKDKVVFITGTAGGQGRAAALLFAKEGAQVFGCDVKEGDAEETVELVRSQGGRMESTCPVDLSDPLSAKRWIDEGVLGAGRIDVLYNNASAVKFALMAEMTHDSWSFTLRNEIDIIFNAAHAAWPYFAKQKRGAIINTASISGHRGNGTLGASAHAAAKGGVIALTKQFAAEGAALGIRANSISPGGIITPGLIAALSTEQRAQIDKMHPIGRAGTPDDIAYCALYLASDEAGWVTGSDFIIDGGLSSIVQ